MCGIVGYIGDREAPPIVVSGLKRLEYRGYDSAGLAAIETMNSGRVNLSVRRAEGKLENLVKSLSESAVLGTVSIGHTRWATHGKPSEKNAHPHRFKEIVIVHNGIIENYGELIAELKKHQHEFSSDTDSEVIAHLIQFYLDREGDLEKSFLKAVNHLKGAFAFAALSTRDPERIFVAKQQCPMVIGLGKNEQFLASDIPALLEFTRDFIFLDDREIAILKSDSVTVKKFDGRVVKKVPHHVEWSLAVAEKEGYPHFMLKEIHEQPRVLRDTLRGRISGSLDAVHFDGVRWSKADWKKFDSVTVAACGTAWHAGLLGKLWIERWADLRCDVDLASEFRYRDPVLSPKSLYLAISQSGETADTLAATALAMKQKLKALCITNTVESSIARKTKNVIYTHAGPEIAVASTKCFMAQLEVLTLLGIKLGLVRGTLSKNQGKKILRSLVELPEKIQETLNLQGRIEEIAKEYLSFQQYFYLGRGFSYPVALEGALKLKEIAYINTQAYPAGEMKHGPIALIGSDWAVVGVCPQDSVREKTISNLEEVKARGGKLIVVGTEGDQQLKALADAWLPIPKVEEELSPFLSTIVLQLFSYYMSTLRGCDVDKPKNLAKSVTVE